MADFTKGPYTRDKYGDIIGADGKQVVVNGLALASANYGGLEIEATTNLFAAAPDMFKALEGLLESHGSAYRNAIEMDESITEAEDAAYAALSKAKGETQ